MNFLFLLSQYLVPQHALSRLAGRLANARTSWFKNLFIRWFIRRYGVNMDEAANPDPAAYACFNAFFTRALRPGARPLPEQAGAIACPADGVVSACGAIHAGSLLQAKGKTFSLAALLGGSEADASPFRDGAFVTVYLSPKDYHRVHMPCAGTLKKMTYVPGKLFSVNQVTCDNIDDLFARNERVVCLFDTAAGPMALVLVGAMIVAGIETVWSGRVAPATRGPSETDYGNRQPPVSLGCGEEMGRFLLGSTVIVAFGPGAVAWQDGLAAGSAVRMGEVIGRAGG